MNSVCCLLLISACVLGTLAKTECEAHRERELGSNVKVNLIPRCDENGDYEAKQCFEGSDFCMCWRKDGTQITAPYRNLKTCACHVHQDREIQRSKTGIIGNFTPNCEANGTYSKKQCHGSIGMCWCGDEDGNRIIEPTRDHLEC